MTSTAFCQRVTCEGSSGVTCTRIPDTWTDPGWWEPEECPHCAGELRDTRPDFEDIVAGLIDELHQAQLLDTSADVDERALFGAIQKELERQSREAWRAKYGLQGLKGKAYDQRVDELIQEGTLPF